MTGSRGYTQGSEIGFMIGFEPIGIVCSCGRTMCRAYPTNSTKGSWAIGCPNNHAEGCEQAAQMDKDMRETIDVLDGSL